MFKKTCFQCGAKVDKLYDSICINCFRENFPPIQEIKPVKFKICNFSGQIFYKSFYYDVEEIEKMLPEIMKKHVVINPHYTMSDLRIEDFEIDGHKLMFEVVTDCEFKE